jgi:hypothetical protein
MVEKLITVTIWATLALIAYEVFKSMSAPSSTAPATTVNPNGTTTIPSSTLAALESLTTDPTGGALNVGALTSIPADDTAGVTADGVVASNAVGTDIGD